MMLQFCCYCCCFIVMTWVRILSQGQLSRMKSLCSSQSSRKITGSYLKTGHNCFPSTSFFIHLFCYVYHFILCNMCSWFPLYNPRIIHLKSDPQKWKLVGLVPRLVGVSIVPFSKNIIIKFLLLVDCNENEIYVVL